MVWLLIWCQDFFSSIFKKCCIYCWLSEKAISYCMSHMGAETCLWVDEAKRPSRQNKLTGISISWKSFVQLTQNGKYLLLLMLSCWVLAHEQIYKSPFSLLLFWQEVGTGVYHYPWGCVCTRSGMYSMALLRNGHHRAHSQAWMVL